MRTDSALVFEMMGGPFAEMNPSIGEFHSSGGLTFTRTDQHGIMVRLWEKRENGWHFRVLTFLTDEQWQSITAAIRAPEPEPKPECTCYHGLEGANWVRYKEDPNCPQHGRAGK